MTKNSVTFDAKVAELRLKNDRLTVWNLRNIFCLQSASTIHLFYTDIKHKNVFYFQFFALII